MDKELAKEVIQILLSIEEDLDRLLLLSTQLSEDEKFNFRKNVAEMIAITGLDLLEPIAKKYPDLDPHTKIFER